MTQSPAQLHKHDIDRLAADASPEVRRVTATKVAAQFGSGRLDEGARRIAEDILRGLMKDAEVRVREALSLHLKSARETVCQHVQVRGNVTN